MKIVNESKYSRKIILVIEFCLIFLGWFFKQTKVILLRESKPAILLVDGFLIGDTVLLRPLLKQVIKKYSDTHRVVFVSGAHAKFIMRDFLHKIDILEFQFPWATYNYGFSSLKKLFLFWFKLYRLRIDVAVECRGDFRSIVWTYLTCPIELIGFDFTGGERLLTRVIPDDGVVVHLFEHVQRIGSVFSIKCDVDDVVLSKTIKRQKKTKKIVGVSFSGSQFLRTLPKNVGNNLLHRMIDGGGYDVLYLLSPQERFLCTTEVEREFGDSLQIFYGGFAEYFNILQSLDCYIGMDSGGGHLCSLWGIPSVIIFGTQNSWYCKPIGDHLLICVESEEQLDCKPCNGVNCANKEFQKCLKDIQIEKVFTSIGSLIL